MLKRRQRLATEAEMDSILVDTWSFIKNADGLMEKTGVVTTTLREACRRSGALPLVDVWESEWMPIPPDLISQRTGDEPV